jgi:hypothetical protein
MAPAGVDHIVRDATVHTALGEGTMHGLHDVAAQAKVAQAAFGIEADHPLGWTCGRGKAMRSSLCSRGAGHVAVWRR